MPQRCAILQMYSTSNRKYMHARTRVRFRTFLSSYPGRTPILCVLLLCSHVQARTLTHTHTDNEHELTSLPPKLFSVPPIVAFWPDAGGANSLNARKFVSFFYAS